ncbi:MAG TPA: hypothetical protein GXZ87_00775 [Bacteroidales bacterium]|nr:hypothetical protein [Bacteroidales bacterium]
MKLRAKIKVIGLILIVLALYFFFSKKEKISINEIDENRIEDFDIILSKGQSMQSKLISLLKLTTEDYSHIGIVIKENDNVFVLHSTPDGSETNGVRYDDLQTFIDLSNVSDFIVLRHKDISSEFKQKLRMEFSRYKTIQAPFDFDFNNFEHKKLYCSELVLLIYEKAGLFTAKEFNLTKPIYPKYFLKMNRLMMVNYKKTSP